MIGGVRIHEDQFDGLTGLHHKTFNRESHPFRNTGDLNSFEILLPIEFGLRCGGCRLLQAALLGNRSEPFGNSVLRIMLPMLFQSSGTE